MLRADARYTFSFLLSSTRLTRFNSIALEKIFLIKVPFEFSTFISILLLFAIYTYILFSNYTKYFVCSLLIIQRLSGLSIITRLNYEIKFERCV